MNQIKAHLQQHTTQLSGIGLIGLGIYWLSIGQTQWALVIITNGVGLLGLKGLHQYLQDAIGVPPDGPMPPVPAVSPTATPSPRPSPQPPATPPATTPQAGTAPQTNKTLVAAVMGAILLAAGGASVPGVVRAVSTPTTLPDPIVGAITAPVVDETDLKVTLPPGIVFAWSVPDPQPGMRFRRGTDDAGNEVGYIFAQLPGQYVVGLSYLDASGKKIVTKFCTVTVPDPSGPPPTQSTKAAKATATDRATPDKIPVPDKAPVPEAVPPPTVAPPAAKATPVPPPTPPPPTPAQVTPAADPILTVVVVQSRFGRDQFEKTFLRDPAFATAMADFDLKYVGPDGKDAAGNLNTQLKVYSDLAAGRTPYYFVVGPPPTEQRLEAGPLTTPVDLLAAWKRARGKM